MHPKPCALTRSPWLPRGTTGSDVDDAIVHTDHRPEGEGDEDTTHVTMGRTTYVPAPITECKASTSTRESRHAGVCAACESLSTTTTPPAVVAAAAVGAGGGATRVRALVRRACVLVVVDDGARAPGACMLVRRLTFRLRDHANRD